MWSYVQCLSHSVCYFFFFNDTATTEIYTLSLHDALPISAGAVVRRCPPVQFRPVRLTRAALGLRLERLRSEEHTSELQSRQYLVCRLLLEKKKFNSMLFSPPPYVFYYSSFTYVSS